MVRLRGTTSEDVELFFFESLAQSFRASRYSNRFALHLLLHYKQYLKLTEFPLSAASLINEAQVVTSNSLTDFEIIHDFKSNLEKPLNKFDRSFYQRGDQFVQCLTTDQAINLLEVSYKS